MYGDPAYWEGWMATWAGRYGAEKVVEWRTNRPAQMSAAIRAYQTAIQTGALSHDGHEGMARHIGNAFRRELRQRDDQDRPLYYIRKERSDSPHKIDLAMAGILSWEARNDGLAAGAQPNQWTIGAV
jgi:phage terminase large subunit-like protein